ncbi:MAG: FkbM family methyltransferase, partial [Planctomycetota bacterium]
MAKLKKLMLNRFFRFLSKGLRDKNAIRLFELLASRLGIEEVVVSSELGKVQGKLDDRGVFTSFLRKKKWSSNFTEFFMRSFRAYGGGTFIDIGANIGLVTIPIANLDTVNCICFEPEPENFALLKSNVERNCPKESCELFHIALYKEESVVELELSADNRGDHRIRSKQGGDASSDLDEKVPLIVMVPARPLDEVVPAEGIKEIIAIKCDTQGAEVGVYLGGQKIISKAKALLMEFWPHGLN